MAILINGILGTCSGVIGTIEGNRSKYGGIIKQRKNVAAQTVGSIKTPQRLAYSKTIALWKSIPTLWKSKFLNDKGNQLSSWNRFVQSNIMVFREEEDPHFNWYILSFSSLMPCDFMYTLQLEASGIIMERITPLDASPYFKPNDKLYNLFFNADGVLIAMINGGSRDSAAHILDVSSIIDQLYQPFSIFSAFANADGTYFNTSQVFFEPD